MTRILTCINLRTNIFSKHLLSSHQPFQFIDRALCNATFLVYFIGLSQASFLTLRFSWPPKSFCGILQAGKMVMTYLSVLWTPWPSQMSKNQCHFDWNQLNSLVVIPTCSRRRVLCRRKLTGRFLPCQYLLYLNLIFHI